jgi:hypothetical protein
MSDADSVFLDQVFRAIEAGKVVPIVGPELVTVAEGGRELPLLRWIADRLAAEFRIPLEGLPEGYALNEVVARHVRGGGRRTKLYEPVFSLLEGTALKPTKALLDLATVARFDLFVSLSFDSLLARALEQANRGPVQTVAYAPKNVRDLPEDWKEGRGALVYHLFGQATVTDEFVICDDDLLEFVHGLQDSASRPARLLGELRNRHLLILGSNLSDWLARFFIRATKVDRLSVERAVGEWLIDTRSSSDAGLVTFFDAFSRDTVVLDRGDPAAFCAALAARWREKHPGSANAERPTGAPERSGLPLAGSIFLSYANEDIEAARKIFEVLDADGMDVWFDKSQLRLGDHWDRIISQAIEDSALFMPIVSRATQSYENRRSYFWKEWNLACEHAKSMAPGEPYVVPVVIDDTSMETAVLPDCFSRVHYATLPGGATQSDFVERIKALYRAYQDRRPDR